MKRYGKTRGHMKPRKQSLRLPPLIKKHGYPNWFSNPDASELHNQIKQNANK